MKTKSTGDPVSLSERRDAKHIGNSDKASKEKSGKDAAEVIKHNPVCSVNVTYKPNGEILSHEVCRLYLH